MLRNIKLTVRYDGADFRGWQRQGDRRTVQLVLEQALEPLLGHPATVTASGRTDAGVHALAQVVHFYTPARHPPEVFLRALNATLPPDVRVTRAEEVPQSFHATLDAKSKRYRYLVDNGPFADPFLRRVAWHVPAHLDVRAMRESARPLLGWHDFRSFETNWPNRLSSVRTVFAVDVDRDGDRVAIEVEADGFLYNMVRAIAGTLVLVGTGARPVSFPGDALRARDRRAAGPNAPARGLQLLRVQYDRRPPTPSRDDGPGPLSDPTPDPDPPRDPDDATPRPR